MNTNQDDFGSPQYWDAEVERFDQMPDHGLTDPAVRQAWANLLAEWLPHPPATILEVGSGTGSLSLLAAALGYQVTGIDFSPAMVARARAKAAEAGQTVPFHVMDASRPELSIQRFDAVLCRHLLWVLPNPEAALARWAGLLTPGGRLVLIEGYWGTGGGLHAWEVIDALPPEFERINEEDLSDRSRLWGKEVHDERFIVATEK